MNAKFLQQIKEEGEVKTRGYIYLYQENYDRTRWVIYRLPRKYENAWVLSMWRFVAGGFVKRSV